MGRSHAELVMSCMRLWKHQQSSFIFWGGASWMADRLTAVPSAHRSVATRRRRRWGHADTEVRSRSRWHRAGFGDAYSSENHCSLVYAAEKHPRPPQERTWIWIWVPKDSTTWGLRTRFQSFTWSLDWLGTRNQSPWFRSEGSRFLVVGVLKPISRAKASFEEGPAICPSNGPLRNLPSKSQIMGSTDRPGEIMEPLGNSPCQVWIKVMPLWIKTKPIQERVKT